MLIFLALISASVLQASEDVPVTQVLSVQTIIIECCDPVDV